jgi:single-strand DNA-binding protein
MRTTPSGARVTSFSVAVNDRRRQADGQTQENTLWFRVSCWNRLGEIAHQYLKKGRSVYVEGRLQLRDFVGQDGQKRYSLDVTALQLQMLDSRSGMLAESGELEGAGSYSRAQSARSQLDDEALPF